jgi:pimeloyl-ACP methyl ester carboxylesterase
MRLPLAILALVFALSAAAPKIELGPCTGTDLPAEARCGTYEVFENRTAKAGRKIPLRLAVLPALGPGRLPDPIVFVNGGPGESAVKDGGEFAQEVAALRQRRDVVLIDVRGTGGSGSLACPEIQGAAGVQSFLDEFMAPDKVRACRDRLRQTADLTQYTTDTAVDDLDEVLGALGYGKVNLVGSSYGTRAVLVYLRRHPERVRTATLEGVLPVDARVPLHAARNAQNALDGLLAECAADQACAAAFPKLREDLAAVFQRVEKEPVQVEVTDEETGRPIEIRLTRNGLGQVLRYMLYSVRASSFLPLNIHLAAQGDWKPMAEFAAAFGSAITSSSEGFYLSVTCAEDVAFLRDEDIPSAVSGTFLGDFRIRQQQAACASWPTAKINADFLAPVVSDVPLLAIAGERDPTTPPADAKRVLRHLKRGRLAIIPDGAHANGGLKGGDCYDRLVAAFIEAGQAETLDTSCLGGMERPAFVLQAG